MGAREGFLLGDETKLARGEVGALVVALALVIEQGPGSFTTLTSTSAPSGAGITALFASPPPLGSTAPAAVNSTTFKSTDAVTCATYAPSGTPAATDAVFFIATRPYNIVYISAVFSVTAGGASKLQVTKDTGTNAPGAGTDILTNNTNTDHAMKAFFSIW